MKSYVWLQTADGSIKQVEEKVAMLSSVISEQAKSGKGSSKNDPISLPQCVTLDMLRLIIDFYRFYGARRSEKEMISFDAEFTHMDTERFCELASAAGSLCLKHLSDFTFHVLSSIPDYLTKEENLEPLRYNDGDIRIRLSNQLLAKKRKEQKESEKQKNVEAEKESVKEPSIDELLEFIEKDSKQAKPPKKKKKNPKKNYQLKDTCKSENHKKPDDDSDDELDPAVMKKIDREVKAFEKSLNKPLPERLQKILSLGKER